MRTGPKCNTIIVLHIDLQLWGFDPTFERILGINSLKVWNVPSYSLFPLPPCLLAAGSRTLLALEQELHVVVT